MEREVFLLDSCLCSDRGWDPMVLWRRMSECQAIAVAVSFVQAAVIEESYGD